MHVLAEKCVAVCNGTALPMKFKARRVWSRDHVDNHCMLPCSLQTSYTHCALLTKTLHTIVRDLYTCAVTLNSENSLHGKLVSMPSTCTPEAILIKIT